MNFNHRIRVLTCSGVLHFPQLQNSSACAEQEVLIASFQIGCFHLDLVHFSTKILLNDYPYSPTIHPFSYVICLDVRKKRENDESNADFSSLVVKGGKQASWHCVNEGCPYSYGRRTDSLHLKVSRNLENLWFPSIVLTRRSFFAGTDNSTPLWRDWTDFREIFGNRFSVDFDRVVLGDLVVGKQIFCKISKLCVLIYYFSWNYMTATTAWGSILELRAKLAILFLDNFTLSRILIYWLVPSIGFLGSWMWW